MRIVIVGRKRIHTRVQAKYAMPPTRLVNNNQY
jgi:hypothetical protein